MKTFEPPNTIYHVLRFSFNENQQIWLILMLFSQKIAHFRRPTKKNDKIPSKVVQGLREDRDPPGSTELGDLTPIPILI